MAVVHVERQLRGANLRIDADPAEVVAVEGNIQPAERRGDAKPLVQAFGDPDAAGVHPHQRRFGDAASDQQIL